MNALTQWNPFRNVTRFDPGTDIDDLFRGFSMRPLMSEWEGNATGMRLDVTEDDTGYSVTADMPGVNKKDIQITAEGNQVVIEAELKRTEKGKDRKQLHTERFYGKTYRSFTLPQNIDSEKCSAHYEDGVLTLTLPKLNNGSSRRIAVH